MEQLAVVQAHEAELADSLKALQADNATLETRYKEQVTLRKKYYNMIEDMKGKIRVYARCRPMAQYEIEKQCKPVVSFPDEYTVELAMEKGTPRQFAWDCAFTPASTQEETYEETENLIQSAIDGACARLLPTDDVSQIARLWCRLQRVRLCLRADGLG